MIKIKHRINTLEDLESVDYKYGVELDIRAEGERLILHHDAFVKGIDFEEYLKEYNHGLMILNTKCEGMEEKILELMEKYQKQTMIVTSHDISLLRFFDDIIICGEEKIIEQGNIKKLLLREDSYLNKLIRYKNFI